VTSTAVLRALTVAVAAAGTLDPALTTMQRRPVPVEVRAANDAAGAAIERQLATDLEGKAAFDGADDPVAIVAVGDISADQASDRMLAGDHPVSTVSLSPSPLSPNVAVVEVTEPSPVPVGWNASVGVRLRGTGMRGTTSRIVLEQNGAQVAHVDHQWTRDGEEFSTNLVFAPPSEGSASLTVRAIPQPTEITDDDNAADVRTLAIGRRLRVLVHELRPSWAAVFVRRALEEDPAFEVSSTVTESKGLRVEGGSPPARLAADALSGFDVVAIGAPEELSAGDVDALESFARRRGGAVVLLPDRRPSGRVLRLMPVTRFDELLTENPVELRSPGGASFRASELVTANGDLKAADVLASLEQPKGAQPIVVEWPLGSGRVLFSGALDAWRFRALSGDGFGRFWRGRMAEAALAAPRRLQLALAPGSVRPGQEVTLRAQLRRTEFNEGVDRTEIPAVRGRIIGDGGIDLPVRFWPRPEPGAFEARFRAPSAGRYNVQASSDDGATADDVLVVAGDAKQVKPEARREMMTAIASATGGIAVEAGDLAPLERYISSLSVASVTGAVHPTRSSWFVAVFIALAASEWALRRRRGDL
jgi:hypothetical protein